jgi:hypothetical protein
VSLAAPFLQQNEFVRPGFELGSKEGDKYYIRNHLQFNILVHPTHGEYMRARQGYKDAAVLDNVNARKLLTKQQLLEAGVSEEQLSSVTAGRELQADAPGAWAWSTWHGLIWALLGSCAAGGCFWGGWSAALLRQARHPMQPALSCLTAPQALLGWSADGCSASSHGKKGA